MVQTDRQIPLSPLDYHYNVVEFSRFIPRKDERVKSPMFRLLLAVVFLQGALALNVGSLPIARPVAMSDRAGLIICEEKAPVKKGALGRKRKSYLERL